jgi:hypothetical protein
VGVQSLQRYVTRQVGWGGQEGVIFNVRRERGLAGFQPNSANRGWIRVRDANGTVRLVRREVSEHGQAHTEERLLGWAQNELGSHRALAEDPARGPGVIELYTEREPCTEETADHARRGREFGNCHRMLTELVNARTVVSWSSPNTAAGHNELMLRHAQRYLRYEALKQLQDAHAARAHLLGGAPRQALDQLHERFRAQILTMAAATGDTFNSWREQLTNTTSEGLRALAG